jgi:hypothetical protein
MRKSARNQPLPHAEAEFLKTLTGVELKARCYNLYESGWTLAAIGLPLAKPRSTVRSWVVSGPYPPQETPTPEDRSYVPKKPKNPGLPPEAIAAIQELAPLARKYRSRLAQSHPATIANQDLTSLCTLLHESGVPLQELADAAGVTYRAMYRRVRNVR